MTPGVGVKKINIIQHLLKTQVLIKTFSLIDFNKIGGGGGARFHAVFSRKLLIVTSGYQKGENYFQVCSSGTFWPKFDVDVYLSLCAKFCCSRLSRSC